MILLICHKKRDKNIYRNLEKLAQFYFIIVKLKIYRIMNIIFILLLIYCIFLKLFKMGFNLSLLL